MSKLLKKSYMYNISGVLQKKRKEKLYNVKGDLYIDTPIVDAQDFFVTVLDNQFTSYKIYDDKIYAPYNNNGKNIIKTDIPDNMSDAFHILLRNAKHVFTSISEIEQSQKKDNIFYDESLPVVNIDDFKKIISNNKTQAEKQLLDMMKNIIITEQNGELCLWKNINPHFRIYPSFRNNATVSFERNPLITDKIDLSVRFPIGMLDAAWLFAERLSSYQNLNPLIDAETFNGLWINEKHIPDYDDQTLKNIVSPLISYDLDLYKQWNENMSYDDIDDLIEMVKHQRTILSNDCERYLKSLKYAIDEHKKYFKDGKNPNYIDAAYNDLEHKQYPASDVTYKTNPYHKANNF